MSTMDLVCMWIAELVPLSATLFSFIYGLRHFFKKGMPLHLQSITMAMGCHSLGSIYHSCQTLTMSTVLEGFTPAYLGRIGFFLFFVAASYGQMDRIVDDGSPKMRLSRIIAAAAPIAAALLYIPCFIIEDVLLSQKLAMLMVWIPAAISLYFNLKHAIIPDFDYGFVKAIKPYNILAVCLGFSELLCLTAWDLLDKVPLVITSVVFGMLCVATMITAKRGVVKWTI